jgi:hypothetical protein
MYVFTYLQFSEQMNHDDGRFVLAHAAQVSEESHSLRRTEASWEWHGHRRTIWASMYFKNIYIYHIYIYHIYMIYQVYIYIYLRYKIYIYTYHKDIIYMIYQINTYIYT